MCFVARSGIVLATALAPVLLSIDTQSELLSVVPPGELLHSVSSDGRFISFTLANNLALRDTATAQIRQLTPGNGTEWTRSSVFSRDGKRIAYSWFGPDQLPEVRIMAADGARQKTIARYERARSISVAQWSRDDKHLLLSLVTAENSSQLVLLRVEDGFTRVWKEWTTPFRHDANIRLSPDGRHVAYKFTPSDIYIISADGTNAPAIHTTPNSNILGWNSDGRRLLFATRASADSDAWSISAISVNDGRTDGAAVAVAHAEPGITPVGLIHGGKAFYGIKSAKLRSQVYIVNIDPVTGRARSEPTLATASFSGAPSYTPEWSADGKYLMFSRPGSGGRNRALHILSLDTGEEHALEAEFTRIATYNWARDNHIIINGIDQKGTNGLFKLNPKTGEASFLGTPAEEGGFPIVSLDGKYVYYRSDRIRSLIKRDLRTTREWDIYRTQAPYVIRGVRLSPDGRQIAFVQASTSTADRLYSELQSGKSIHVVSAEDGTAHELLKATPPEWIMAEPIQGIEWSRDGRYIFFVRARVSGKYEPKEVHELWRIPAAGGQPQKTGLQMAGLGWPVMHPEGSKLAFVNFFLGRTEVWSQLLTVQ